jgi:hypothetical protein
VLFPKYTFIVTINLINGSEILSLKKQWWNWSKKNKKNKKKKKKGNKQRPCWVITIKYATGKMFSNGLGCDEVSTL